MAVFSTNQNRQFYVLNSTPTVKTLGDKEIQFTVTNGAGVTVSTPLIDATSITYGKLTAPSDTEIKLKQATVKITDEPIAGEDYVLRINFRQLYGMSDEDIYQTYGVVHATKNMTKEQFYVQMIISLFKNLKRFHSKFLVLKVGNSTVAAVSESNKKLYSDTAMKTAITTTSLETSGFVISESATGIKSDWVRGTAQIARASFDVIPTTVYDGTDDVVWGTVEVADSTTEKINNGYAVADMEYFYLGERGDQYRLKKWPNVIPSQYDADATKEYYILDLHYAYQGTCEDIQKSEKDITFVSTTKADLTAIGKAINLINPIVYDKSTKKLVPTA